MQLILETNIFHAFGTQRMRERESHQLPVLTEHKPHLSHYARGFAHFIQATKSFSGIRIIAPFYLWGQRFKVKISYYGCRANKRERKPGCEHNQFASRASMLSPHAILPTDRTLATSASPKHSHALIFLGLSQDDGLIQ